MGDSGPPLLSLVFGRESKEGVDKGAVATPNMGFTRARVLRGVCSSASRCEARRRLPKGEFLSPDMMISGVGEILLVYLVLPVVWRSMKDER